MSYRGDDSPLSIAFFYVEIIGLIPNLYPATTTHFGTVTTTFLGRDLPNWLFKITPGRNQSFDLLYVVPGKQRREIIPVLLCLCLQSGTRHKEASDRDYCYGANRATFSAVRANKRSLVHRSVVLIHSLTLNLTHHKLYARTWFTASAPWLETPVAWCDASISAAVGAPIPGEFIVGGRGSLGCMPFVENVC